MGRICNNPLKFQKFSVLKTMYQVMIAMSNNNKKKRYVPLGIYKKFNMHLHLFKNEKILYVHL